MQPQLFQPFQLGDMQLSHRVVLAPLTRERADLDHILPSYAVKYYADRASVPGSLLITEGTVIAPYACGIPTVPGIWSEEQLSRWKEVRYFVLAEINSALNEFH
jgi:NADPH2 dehydrogenase